ncbi:MAG: 3-oxoacyl-ACP synthase [Treponema sp.]|jgi:3-oxoacyl-[acyl-carrier-protein] synthase-1|nr:3-oxoacyl-ACP synthase [Treponema sp.]
MKNEKLKKKIYMSAPALVCCAGMNRNELYESCLSGYQGGLAMRELPGTGERFPVGIIRAELPEVNLPEPVAQALDTKIIRVINAALEQLRPDVEKAVSRYGPKKIGVCLGSCDIGSEAVFLAQHVLFAQNTLPEDFSRYFRSASYSAEFIARKFGVLGPAFTVAAACASGASAIMRAVELIRTGCCDAVIAGGADVVTDTVFAGFHSLEVLSGSLSNPFSKNRKGINLGEGAAFFLLESEKNSSVELSSPVELLGVGESVDACHMTRPGTDGAGPAKAMRAAILDAGISGEQIGYVNFHGTGTVLNDKAENLAMETVFGAAYPPSSSTKPITGHTLGAAGALEAAICWAVLKEQRGLPVHCWDGVKDEEIPFPPADNSVKKTQAICMSNSFGFGGCNVSLILGNGENEK